MRIPKTPPDEKSLLDLASTDVDHFMRVLAAADAPGKYLHWDKLLHYPTPEGVTHEEWWGGIKFRRQSSFKDVPLVDKGGQKFRYSQPDPIPATLHQIDLGAGGLIQMPEQITNPDTRDQYYVGSLIDEAITSSQLEGATTTRPVAKEMIRTGREPRDRSERMILNNYRAMQRINEFKKKPLSRELVLELHRLVSDQTLDDPSASGRFRRADENVRMEGTNGEVYHEPPPASSLEGRIQKMCDFANGKSPQHFIHPVLRSIILHFWLAYDHPFVDGNGRTARALFYWSMLHCNYWLCEFISISHIIRKAPVKYGRAFLYTETDNNDLTYFIIYHLEVIQRAIQELHEYITKKTTQLRRLEATLRGMDALNHRQRALIGHALRHPNQRYTVESHKVSHNVVYETARTDLLDLCDRGLLSKHKIGKTGYFVPESDIEEKLSAPKTERVSTATRKGSSRSRRVVPPSSLRRKPFRP
jgi:Fic family protein